MPPRYSSLSNTKPIHQIMNSAVRQMPYRRPISSQKKKPAEFIEIIEDTKLTDADLEPIITFQSYTTKMCTATPNYPSRNSVARAISRTNRNFANTTKASGSQKINSFMMSPKEDNTPIQRVKTGQDKSRRLESILRKMHISSELQRGPRITINRVTSP